MSNMATNILCGIPTLPSSSTPSSYCPLNFSIPPVSSLPVGLLACQRDPNLKSLETSLVKSQLVQRKLDKKDKSSIDLNSPPLYELLLHDTCLFPEGGGQPADTGSISLIGTTLKLRVENAIRRNLDALHFVRLPEEEAQRKEAEDWLSSGQGKSVLVEVDWDRRIDHMQCHTGQHLISALFETLPSPLTPIPTLSWGLPSFPNPPYIELPRLPTSEEFEWVSSRMNQLISGSEGSIPSVRVEVEQEEDVVRPDSIPDNYKDENGKAGRKGVIRTVIIDGVDRNPCCGTHLTSLSPLSPSFILPLTSATKVRGTNIRLYFSFGSRTLTFLSSGWNSNLEISKSLGCNESEALVRIQELLKRDRDVKKKESKKEEEWAREKAIEILEKSLKALKESDEKSSPLTYSIKRYKDKQASLSGSSLRIETVQGEKSQVIVSLHRTEATLESISSLSKESTDLCSHLENQKGEALPLVIICASCGTINPPPNTSSEGSLLIFSVGGGTHLSEASEEVSSTDKKVAKKSAKKETPAQLNSAKIVSQVAKHVTESELGKKVKGGGNKGRWQGKLVRGWSAGDEELKWESLKKGVES